MKPTVENYQHRDKEEFSPGWSREGVQADTDKEPIRESFWTNDIYIMFVWQYESLFSKRVVPFFWSDHLAERGPQHCVTWTFNQLIHFELLYIFSQINGGVRNRKNIDKPHASRSSHKNVIAHKIFQPLYFSNEPDEALVHNKKEEKTAGRTH